MQISYCRPTALSDDQLRSWLVGQAGSLMSVTLEPTASHEGRGLVQVRLAEFPHPSRAEAVIARLMGDMRMLGLQPVIVARA